MRTFIFFVFNLLLSFASFGQFNNNFFVDDKVNLLTSQEQYNLTQKLKNYEGSTTTEINIVIINSLNGQKLETYSYTLAKSRGIGKKNINNGILILVVKQDKKIRIEVGYGLEAKLSDASCKKIINQIIKPNFRNKTYYQGLNQTIDQIISILANDGGGVENRLKPIVTTTTTKEPIVKTQYKVQTSSSYLFNLVFKIVNVCLIMAYVLSFMYRSKFKWLVMISIILCCMILITEVFFMMQIESNRLMTGQLKSYFILVVAIVPVVTSLFIYIGYSFVLGQYSKKNIKKNKQRMYIMMIIYFLIHTIFNFQVFNVSFYLPFYLASLIIYVIGYQMYYYYFLDKKGGNSSYGRRGGSSYSSYDSSSSYSSYDSSSSYSSYDSSSYGSGGDFGGGGASGDW